MHISALTGKTLKQLQSFAPMLYAKDECCINNNGDNSRIIGRERERERERGRHLITQEKYIYKPF